MYIILALNLADIDSHEEYFSFFPQSFKPYVRCAQILGASSPWRQTFLQCRTILCGSSVLNPLRVSLTTSRIPSSFLDLENLYKPVVCYSAILPLNISFHCPRSIIFHAIYLFAAFRANQSSSCLTSRSGIGSTIFSSRLRKMHDILMFC